MKYSAKEINEFKIIDLLEQIQAVDNVIKVYEKAENDAVALSVIKQYEVRRQEFLNKLNRILKKYSVNVNILKQSFKKMDTFKKEPKLHTKQTVIKDKDIPLSL